MVFRGHLSLLAPALAVGTVTWWWLRRKEPLMSLMLFCSLSLDYRGITSFPMEMLTSCDLFHKCA